MCVITELDKLLPYVLTDMVCGYLPLQDIRIQMMDRDRVYLTTSDSYGLRIPHKAYYNTVWDHRWRDIDLSPGIQLFALTQLTKECSDYAVSERDGFSVEDAKQHIGDILGAVFVNRINDTDHPNCCSGFAKWLRGKPEQITEQEWSFISDHWQSVWMPRLMIEILGYDEHTFRLSGMDVLIAHMMQASLNYFHVTEACLRSSLEYIEQEFGKRQISEFLMKVWIPHRDIFVELHESLLLCSNEDQQFNEFMHKHNELWKRFLYPPLTAVGPYPHVRRDPETDEWSPVTLFGIVET